MTLNMADSVTPGNMQMGYHAYLGYVDGIFQTAPRLPQLFPGARVLTLTVLGGGARADGCDRETGDLSAGAAAEWLHLSIIAGQWRPVLYASRDNVPEVLDLLGDAHVARSRIRILSAHYGDGEHICGPSTCKASFQADGTQWTDTFPGVGGAAIDMSLLADDFFGPVEPPSAWVFGAVRGLTPVAGHTSVLLSWSAPGTPEPAGVHHYQVTVRHEGQDVASYPRDVPKGGNPQTWQGGSLAPGTTYEALVRAMTADRKHGSPWAAVTFTTGHG